MNTRFKRRALRVGVALAAIAGLTLGTSVPAQAVTTNLAIVYVKSSTSVTGYTSWDTGAGDRASLYVTSYWTSHTATSAKLTSFKVCVGNLGASTTWVMLNTDLARSGHTIIDYGSAIKIYSQSCKSYAVNKTYTRISASNPELVRVWAHIVQPWDGSLFLQTVGIFR